MSDHSNESYKEPAAGLMGSVCDRILYFDNTLQLL
jgi:hypothetical protein